MARKNPLPPLPEGSFYDGFSKGVLGPEWTASYWTAPGGSANHVGFWNPNYIDLSDGMLRLMLDQRNTVSKGNWNANTNSPALVSGVGTMGDYYTVSVAGSTEIDGLSPWTVGQVILFDGRVWRQLAASRAVLSVGAEVSTTQEFGYGTYEFAVKSLSTNDDPTQVGNPVSGSITGAFIYADTPGGFTEIDFEVEGKSTDNLNNYYQMTSWTSDTLNTTSKVLAPNPEDAFYLLKFVWRPTSIEFYINGKLIETRKTHVPSVPAPIKLNAWGTNGVNWGGVATVNLPRYMFVSHVQFVPLTPVIVASGSYVVQWKSSNFAAGDAGNLVQGTGTYTTVWNSYGAGYTGNNPGTDVIFATGDYFVNWNSTGVGSIVGQIEPEVFAIGSYGVMWQSSGNGFTTAASVTVETDWKSPRAIQTSWVGGDNLKAPDTNYATTVVQPNSESAEIYASDFGFNVPEGSSIDEIKVKFRGYVAAGSIEYSYFRLIDKFAFQPRAVNEFTITFGGTSGATDSDTGWYSPTLSNSPGWIDPNSMFADDADASYYNNGSTAESPPFKVYGFTGISVPTGSTIKGLQVDIKLFRTSPLDYGYVKIGDASGAINTVDTKSIAAATTTPGYLSLGGPTDLWGGKAGVGPWTAGDINSNLLVYGAFAGITELSIEHIRLKVFFSSGTGSAGVTEVIAGVDNGTFGGVDEDGNGSWDRAWTPADVNKPDFCVWGAFGAGANGLTPYLDCIQTKLKYTTAQVGGGNPSTEITVNTGWVSPTTSSSTGWTNPNNIFAEDGANATVTQASGESPVMRGYGFPFNIPTDVTIVGIELRNKAQVSAALDYSYATLGNTAGTVNSGDLPLGTFPVAPTAAAYVVTGSPTELWAKTWTPADFADFMVSQAFGVNTSTTINVDHMQVRVHYKTTTGTTPSDPPPAWDGNILPVPASVTAIYSTGWSGEDITSIPMIFNTIYLFHAVPASGGAFRMEYGPGGTPPSFIPERIKICRGRGQRCILTVGGAGAAYNFQTRAESNNFIASFKTMYNLLGGVDGCDFNNFEAGVAPAPAEMVYIAQQLKAFYGSNFSISAAPHPGAGWAPQDRVLMKAMNDAGVITYVAPQFYDDPSLVPPATIQSLANEWVTLLGNANKLVIGLGANYGLTNNKGQTIAQVRQALTAIKTAHPTLRGAFGWNATSDRAAGWTFGAAIKEVLSGTTPVPPPTAPPPPPPPAPTPTPPPTAAKILTTYYTGWSGGNILNVPVDVYTQVNLFHATPPGDYTGDGTLKNEYTGTFTRANVQAMRARGQRVMLTVGGARVGVYFADRAMSTRGLNSLKAIIDAMGGVDGLDWNCFEQFTQRFGSGAAATTEGNELAWISGQLKATYGSNFTISMAPGPGASYAAADRVISGIMNTAGVLDYAAPQFYDDGGYADPNLIKTLVNQWVAHLGAASKVMIGVGSNYGPGTTTPTTAQTVQMYREIKATHPTIRGVFGWSFQDDAAGGLSFGRALRAVL